MFILGKLVQLLACYVNAVNATRVANLLFCMLVFTHWMACNRVCTLSACNCRITLATMYVFTVDAELLIIILQCFLFSSFIRKSATSFFAAYDALCEEGTATPVCKALDEIADIAVPGCHLTDFLYQTDSFLPCLYLTG